MSYTNSSWVIVDLAAKAILGRKIDLVIDTAVALATSLESATTEYTLVDVATI